MGLRKNTVLPTLTIGERVFTDLTNLKILKTYITTSARYSTYKNPDGTAYSVPANKTLKVKALAVRTSGPAIAIDAKLLYGDTDVGFNSAAAPTNPIYTLNDSNFFELTGMKGAYNAQVMESGMEQAVEFSVPTGKFVTSSADNAPGFFILYGYEV